MNSNRFFLFFLVLSSSSSSLLLHTNAIDTTPPPKQTPTPTYESTIKIIAQKIKTHDIPPALYPTIEDIKNLVNEEAALRRPFLLTGLDIGEVWDLKDLSDANPELVLQNIFHLPEKQKTFAIRSPMQTDPAALRTDCRVGCIDVSLETGVITPSYSDLYHNLTLFEFLDFNTGHASKENLYWRGDLRETTQYIVDSASFWPAFIIDDYGKWKESPPSSSSSTTTATTATTTTTTSIPLLHFSSSGVTNTPKYSKSHTIHIQLSGTTRILLQPPGVDRFMYPYPSIHAARGMSQIPFSSEVREDHEKLFEGFTENVIAFDVEVKEGEVLYIPPFWWHTVHTSKNVNVTTANANGNGTHRNSVAMSISSLSSEEEHVKKALTHPLPFSKLKTKIERMVGVQVLLVHLLSWVDRAGGPAVFGWFLYDQRFKLLFPEFGIEFNSGNDKDKDTSKQSEGEGSSMCFIGSEQGEYNKALEYVMNEISGDIGKSAYEISLVFEDDKLNASVKLGLLGDFVEALIDWSGRGTSTSSSSDLDADLNKKDKDKDGSIYKKEYESERNVVWFLTKCLNYGKVELNSEDYDYSGDKRKEEL